MITTGKELELVLFTQQLLLPRRPLVQRPFPDANLTRLRAALSAQAPF